MNTSFCYTTCQAKEIIDIGVGFYVLACQAEVDDHDHPKWRGLRDRAVLLGAVSTSLNPVRNMYWYHDVVFLDKMTEIPTNNVRCFFPGGSKTSFVHGHVPTMPRIICKHKQQGVLKLSACI
jgi:hypothetical protein